MANKIMVYHTRIEINDYELGDCPRLEFNYSIYDSVRHETYVKGLEYDQETKVLTLPRGSDIKELENLFMCNATVSHEPDPYVNTDPIPIKYLPRDERQKISLQFLIGLNKYNYTRSKSQLAVNTNTGSG